MRSRTGSGSVRHWSYVLMAPVSVGAVSVVTRSHIGMSITLSRKLGMTVSLARVAPVRANSSLCVASVVTTWNS